MTTAPLAVRTDVTITADVSRVVTRSFVPGHELMIDAASRASGVLARVLALTDDVVSTTLAEVQARYAGRHRDFRSVLVANYDRVAHRIPRGTVLTDERRLLVGAFFTHEYTIEGAALFNPSIVMHPDQSDLSTGEQRFILSLRAVGEGHLSCMELRTGVVGPGRAVRVDDPGAHAEIGLARPTSIDRSLFASRLAEEGIDAESESFLIGCLPPVFDEADLDGALTSLRGQSVTRHGVARTAELARRLLQCTYTVEFPVETTIAERVLWPSSPSESHGIEDVRFVRFVSDEGTAVYRGTYTAFDGAAIEPQIIETTDFRTFRMSQLAGPAAKNKGMALFPRTVGGRFMALSRWDRESTSLTTSTDGQWWSDARTLQRPTRPWELIQTGNCGSPIETAAGWVVLTHGVGPMREYAIGALLLDLDDPAHVLGELREPLLRPSEGERTGYVPNVLYTCGALVVGEHLLLPYGVGDSTVRFAFVEMDALLDRLLSDGPAATTRANRSA